MSRTARLWFVTTLTFVRVPLVVAFCVCAIVNSLAAAPSSRLFDVSMVLLVTAALTDLFDGYFARKLGVTTQFGSWADPMTDKVYYLVCLPLLIFLSARNGHINHSVVLLCFTIVFLARDQWITFLRSLGSAYQMDARANWSGKLRTFITFPLIWLIYAFEESGRPVVSLTVMYALEALAFVVNLISIRVYSRYYWPCLLRSVSTDTKRK